MTRKITLISLTLLIFSINLTTISAHFFPNTSSIPKSLIPNKTLWNDFNNFTGCKKGVKAPGLRNLKNYFHYFGYLNNTNTNFSDEFDADLESAVKTYQLNFNLNSTGELDPPTLRHVTTPRCGNPDVVNGSSTMHFRSANSTAVAHYSFFPNRPRWPRGRTQLTYAFDPANQLSDLVRGVFSRAFERWSEVTLLTFVEAATFNRADIRIGFFSGDHGDGEPFDGVLGTLAHAFAPTVGVCHFDGDENWVIDGDFLNSNPFSAVDLESVAVHEIGHLLGLGHSSVEEAIMYPSISSGLRKVELANDDILGVQELYGSNPNYNGSGPTLTPAGERDTSGVNSVGRPVMLLLVVGIFSLLGLFV